MVGGAGLVGVGRARVRWGVAGLAGSRCWVRPELACPPGGRQWTAYVLDPPGLAEDIAEIWQDLRSGVIAAPPDWARAVYGFPPQPPTAARQPRLRPALARPPAGVRRGPGRPAAPARRTARAGGGDGGLAGGGGAGSRAEGGR